MFYVREIAKINALKNDFHLSVTETRTGEMTTGHAISVNNRKKRDKHFFFVLAALLLFLSSQSNRSVIFASE